MDKENKIDQGQSEQARPPQKSDQTRPQVVHKPQTSLNNQSQASPGPQVRPMSQLGHGQHHVEVQPTVEGQPVRTGQQAPRFNGPQLSQHGPQANQQGQRQPMYTRRRPDGKRPHRNRPAARKEPKKFDFTKLFLNLLAGILVIAVLSLSFSIYLKEKYKKDILPVDAAASKMRDAVLVLGCSVYPDGSPSPMLKDRLDKGIEVYFKGAGNKLILSGDSSPYYDEVQVMHQYALDKGVKGEDIFLDYEGYSTWESIQRAQDLFGAESLCIISQEYHLYRAIFLGKSLGLDVCGVAAQQVDYPGQWGREIREVLARVKDIYSASFKPDANPDDSYYDISGSGYDTWRDNSIEGDQ